jgi:hypothetical protein
VDPETSNRVHEVLDMNQELELCYTSAQPDKERTFFNVLWSVEEKSDLGQGNHWYQLRTSPVRTRHHQSIIPNLILVLQSERYWYQDTPLLTDSLC